MRILLVEDNRQLGEGVRAGLAQAGFAADWAQDGEEAELALASQDYDAMVLDLGLPKRDGLAVLRQLRAGRRTLPVLILTARDAVPDRITGLDAGADDYLVKPFELGELQARLRALLRRSKGVSETVVRHGRVTLDPRTREVTLDGGPVELSAREFATLQELILSPGQVFSKHQLEEKIYGWGEEIESNTVEVYVHHLRRKLYPALIRTVRGVGYTIPRATE